MPTATPANQLPTPALLRAMLEAAGATVSAPDELLNFYLGAAYQAFENETGNRPFLASNGAVPTVRTFGAVNGLVDFGAPCQVQSVAFNSYLGAEFWPAHAYELGLHRASDEAATWLQFSQRFTTFPQAIQISGLWAFCTQIAPDVSMALQARAALYFLGVSNLDATAGGAVTAPGTVKKRDDDGVSVEYETGAGGARAQADNRARAIASLGATWRDALKTYRL